MSAPPDWTLNPPLSEGYLYAIGSYSGSLNWNDNYPNATKDSLKNLGQLLNSKIKSVSRVHGTSAGITGSFQVRIESTGEVHNVEVVEYWVDEEGQRGTRWSVWALVRIGSR